LNKVTVIQGRSWAHHPAVVFDERAVTAKTCITSGVNTSTFNCNWSKTYGEAYWTSHLFQESATESPKLRVSVYPLLFCTVMALA